MNRASDLTESETRVAVAWQAVLDAQAVRDRACAALTAAQEAWLAAVANADS